MCMIIHAVYCVLSAMKYAHTNIHIFGGHVLCAQANRMHLPCAGYELIARCAFRIGCMSCAQRAATTFVILMLVQKRADMVPRKKIWPSKVSLPLVIFVCPLQD